MSHYYVLILTEADPEALLEPYSEHLEVPEYDKRCFCVGRKAMREAERLMCAELGTWGEARDAFGLAHPEPRPDKPYEDMSDEERSAWAERLFDHHEQVQPIWMREVARPRRAREAELLAGMENREAPDPECEECHGSGSYLTTYNPKSKFDWYVEGGRWSEIPSRRPARDYLEQLPFAIITPDGEWHEKGKMLWFAVVDNEDEDWPARARALLEQHAEVTAYVYDLHI